MDQRLPDPAGAAPPDWRGLCEELVEALSRWVEPHMGPEYETELVIKDVELLDRALAALEEEVEND